MTEDREKTAPIRKRDAGATAAAIVAAARDLFGQRGFDSVGTREIADCAGVNVALISRYFGSKAGLFAAAVPPTMSFDDLLEGEMCDFGARIAALMVTKKPALGYDPVLALLHSAATPDVAPLLTEALTRQVIAPLAARLQGPGAMVRAQLIAAQIAGLSLWVKVLGGLDPDPDARAAFQQRLADMLQDLVDR